MWRGIDYIKQNIYFAEGGEMLCGDCQEELFF